MWGLHGNNCFTFGGRGQVCVHLTEDSVFVWDLPGTFGFGFGFGFLGVKLE